MRAVVCLPTYDERENLEPMLRALGEVLGPDDRVLVIDDNSPDGTGELADRLAAELPFVDVLHRERKEGLGPAYIAGFRRALAAGAELVLEIDCDFSHDPKDVPRLIAAAADADVVLGSRYVRGGRGAATGGSLRRAISQGASLYTQLLLMPVKDATGRLQVLPPRGARARSTSTPSRRAATCSRSRRRSGRGARASGSSRSRSRSSTGAWAARRCRRGIVLEAIWKVPALRLAALRGQV